MHYFQHNIADYRKDTMHLSLLEHGVYRQLLDQYYLNEGPLPLDQDRICRIINAKSLEEKEAVFHVLQDFFIKNDAGFIHKRCDLVINEYNQKSQKASKSAKIRWDNANGMQSHSEPNANHKPLTINHKPLTNIKPLSDFDMFWIAYPKKVGKEAARKAWAKANPELATVLNALEWQKVSPQWFKNNGQYIPNPSTWINQHRWEDEQAQEQSF